ncbi:MAG TPA: sn-glycerol-1-phosphate dehydrogenase [Clostridia bacterium]|nr:sn-glycerol-1-phosphate dehydrogenase [Clostridia bacterium]
MKNNNAKDILNTNIGEMPGLSFECACGRRHSVDIEKIIAGNGILYEIAATLEPFKGGKLLVISDTNTYGIFGKAVAESLLKEGFILKTFIFESKDHALIPDERAIGRLLIELGQDTSLILAVGSGVLNDLARIVAYRTGKAFAIAGTAPSMDGYASVVSPLIINGKKNTYPGKYPSAIFADTSIMRNAPMVMIRAGYGDVLGKLTSLAEWKLSNIINNEYYCETIAKLVRKGVDRCIESTDGLASREEKAIRHLIEALILTGISMGLAGISRPASGTEHQLAHYWEVKDIEAGREHALHGNAVGAATVVTAMLYELAADILPKELEYPSSKYVKELLERIGAQTSPKDLGIGRELFEDSLMNAMYLRDRYSLLRFCHDKEKLSEYKDILVRRFYD